MRTIWVFSGLCVLVTMGFVTVGFGQHTLMTKLLKREAEIAAILSKLDATINESQFLRDMQQKLKEQKKTVRDLMEELMKLTPEEQKKNSESEACWAEKRKMEEDLAAAKRETMDTEATMTKEREVWAGGLIFHKRQTEQRSKLCDFVQSTAMAQKLCPI